LHYAVLLETTLHFLLSPQQVVAAEAHLIPLDKKQAEMVAPAVAVMEIVQVLVVQERQAQFKAIMVLLAITMAVLVMLQAAAVAVLEQTAAALLALAVAVQAAQVVMV
jgi:hypothetical protein